jgi:hypothetical protein
MTVFGLLSSFALLCVRCDLGTLPVKQFEQQQTAYGHVLCDYRLDDLDMLLGKGKLHCEVAAGCGIVDKWQLADTWQGMSSITFDLIAFT